VTDAWRVRCSGARDLRENLESRITDLQRRQRILDDAFLYERRIDSETYERQRDALREQIAVLRLEQDEARLEEIDVEGLLAFAEYVMANASRLWQEASLVQREHLQAVLFPAGLTFDDGRLGTAVTCLAFTQLRAVDGEKSDLASPSGTARSWTREIPGEVEVA